MYLVRNTFDLYKIILRFAYLVYNHISQSLRGKKKTAPHEGIDQFD